MTAAIFFVACNGEQSGVVSPERPTAVQFYAEVESVDARTHIDAERLTYWNEDDRITIFVGETYNREFAFDGFTGDAEGGFDQVSIDKTFYSAYDLDANYAIYPHSATNQLRNYDRNDPSAGGYFLATLPAEQRYTERSFAPGAFAMVAVTEDPSDGRLVFKNVGGCICISLYGEEQIIRSVSVTGNRSEPLAGRAKVEHRHGGLPTTTLQSDLSTTVKMVAADGIKLGTTAATATQFWLAIPPTTFTEGFTITIEGFYGGKATRTTTKQQIVARNTFLVMPAFEVAIATSETGMGIGGWGDGSENSGTAE